MATSDAAEVALDLPARTISAEVTSMHISNIMTFELTTWRSKANAVRMFEFELQQHRLAAQVYVESFLCFAVPHYNVYRFQRIPPQSLICKRRTHKAAEFVASVAIQCYLENSLKMPKTN